jgi:hypothetical protein
MEIETPSDAPTVRRKHTTKSNSKKNKINRTKNEATITTTSSSLAASASDGLVANEQYVIQPPLISPSPDINFISNSNIAVNNDNNANFTEMEKLAKITQLLELMDEANKKKDWLIDLIKQKRQKISIKPEMSIIGILKMCSLEFIANTLGYLQSNEFADILDIDIPPITKNYHWFFTDIVAASDSTITTVDQARKIILLNKLIETTDIFKQRDPETTLILPTGDGMAIGFDDSPEKPLQLAIEVHKGLNRYNRTRKKEDRIELRIGLDSGPVYIIKDLNGNENVWGPGIIMARRVMDLADKMNILASARYANDVKMLRPEYKSVLHPIGDYQIKHGDTILVYNVYTDEIGNKKPPAADKRQASKAAEEERKTITRFLFSSISIDLQIKDIRTMMAHHVMTWNLTNVSNEPVERLFYYLEGDVPRSFQDLNVVIKDEDDRELEIFSLNVNKPYRKEFFVKFRKPLKPGEKGRIAVLEYDWEEVERKYFYRFASDCKKFNFALTVPRELDVNQKVVKVDTETGEKTYAATPAMVKRLPDRTEISWSATNLRAYEAYRFDW